MVYVNPMFYQLFIIGALLLCTVSPVWAQKQLLDRVVAVVNDEAITQSELDLFLRPLYEEFKRQYKGEELRREFNEARLKLLNQMIEDRLVFQEAKTRGITIEDSETDKLLDEMRARFPSEEEFEKTLIEQGFTLTKLRENLKRQATVRRLHDMEIRAQVVVSPLEIEEYYKNHSSEFTEEEKIKVRSITIRKGEDAIAKGLTDEAAKKKLESIEGKIRSGKKFEDLAQEFSEDARAKEGGMMGWVKRGEMLQEIEEALFGFKEGEISNVLETPMGYHLFKVEEKQIGRIAPLDEVRDKIRDVIFRQKAQKRFKEWMDELKAKAFITIR
ncbi:MAG: peptidylprolyl isomerase [Candidatus Omnitrophica bacterium]|nr:peptidylprolyl isomerase [Candidatus Omnitrophota bacterium]